MFWRASSRGSVGAYEAWFVDPEGMITEGAASNAWIINKAAAIVTHQIDHSILRGITRTTLIEIIAAERSEAGGKKIQPRRGFCRTEAFVTGATTLVMPVVRIDGRQIGTGVPGPVAIEIARDFS